MNHVYENLSLFSDYFLSERLPQTDWWDANVSEAFEQLQDIYEREKTGLETANESQTEDDFIKPVLRDVLGWHLDSQWETKKQGRRQVPDFALFQSQKVLQEAKSMRDDDTAFEARVDAVAEAKYWGRSLDGSSGDSAREEWTNRNPSFQITSYMQTTHRDWGILTNGQTWRLYYAHVRSKVETHYEVDLLRILENEDREEAQEQFKWFYLFFRAAAHQELPGREPFLNAVYEQSEAYAAQLEDRLKDLVFNEIFPTLAEGFLADGGYDGNVTDETLDEIYRGTLRFLYRLLFLLHAEARGLLPVDEDAYQSYSLHRIKADVAEIIDEQRTLSSVSTDIWNDLLALFKIIDRGDPELNVPRYNGGLFSSEKPANQFFEDYEIADNYLLPAIDKLARTDDDDTGRRNFVDYKALDVEQLGSIYEGLLEFQLEFDENDELILINDRGERHATGSFYTPHYIVEYIVENTLRSILERRREAFEDAMRRVEKWRPKSSTHPHKLERAQQDAVDALLDLKICDPAMGSGHFLVEAVDWLTRHFIEILDEYPDNPVMELIESIREDVVASLEDQGVEVDQSLLKDINLLKRLVMKRCIFGVDLNPMAVELSKLSLWLDSFTVGAPLSFLDHHLRAGNSLVGAWIDEVNAQLRGDLFGSAFSGMLTATQFLSEVAAHTDATIQEVERSVAKFREYQKAMKPYKVLLDCALGEYFETPESHGFLVEQGPKIRKAIKARQNDNEVTDLDEREKEILTKVAEKQTEYDFFHWELEFPEVFFDLERADWKDDPGFDAVVGNPPYIRMEQFKALKDFLGNEYEVHADRMDLYGYFIEQGIDLLNRDGQKGYIVSNKWLRANYGEPIRELVPQRASVRRLVDFRDLPVFPDASTYPLILVLTNGADADAEGQSIVMQDLDFDSLDEVVDNRAARFTQEQLQNAGWALVGNPGFALLSRLEREHSSLADYVGSPPLRGIVSGRNEAFVIDSATRDELIEADPKSDEIIYPLRTGKDVRRYWMRDADTFLIYTYHGVDIDRYPAIEEHLEPYREALEGRATEQEWYELQQPQEAYQELFEEPKIVQPDFADRGRFHLDETGCYLRSKAYFLPTSDYALLAVLNSRLATFYLKAISIAYRGGYMNMKAQYVENLPIPSFESDCSETGRSDEVEAWVSHYQAEVRDHLDQPGTRGPGSAWSDLLKSIDLHLEESPARTDVVRDILAELARVMTQLHDERRHFNLNPIVYIGERTDGAALPDAGTYHPAVDTGLLTETSESLDNLRIGSVYVDRTYSNIEVSATVRYKPQEPENHDIDQYGYTEQGPFSAFRLTGLDEEIATLIEVFVPAAAERGDGFANFRENAAKTISPLDRFKDLQLPRLSRVSDDLRRYIETRNTAQDLDRRIELTDDLIDQIVYRLYDLTDDEIRIIEGEEPVENGDATSGTDEANEEEKQLPPGPSTEVVEV